MSFEQIIRDRLSKAPHGSTEKSILKVVLGDVQQKSALGEFTLDMGHALVRKMIKANDETLPHLPAADPRRGKLLEENQILGSLLPQYWSVQQVCERLQADGVNIKDAKNDGQAMGLAMQHLKKLNAPVEGQTVKEAVAQMRKA
jgi:hypothetical protein